MNQKKLTESIFKSDPTIYCLQNIQFISKDAVSLNEVKVQKTLFYTYSNQKRTGVARLPSDKMDFKSKTFKRQKTLEIDKKSTHQEDRTIICTNKTEPSKCMGRKTH